MIQEFDTEQLNGVPGNKVEMEMEMEMERKKEKKKEKREQQENKKIDSGF